MNNIQRSCSPRSWKWLALAAFLAPAGISAASLELEETSSPTWGIPAAKDIVTGVAAAAAVLVIARLAATLAEREAELREVLDNANVAIFIVQGRQFLMVNKTFEQMTGYRGTELLSLEFPELIHPEHRELVRERAAARQRGEQAPQHYEAKAVVRDGSMRWVSISASPVIDFGGKPAVIGTVQDITRERLAEEKLQESEEKYRRLTEEMQDVVWTLDIATRRLLYISPSVSRLLGYAPEELLAATLGEPFLAEFRKAVFAPLDGEEAGDLPGPGRYFSCEQQLTRKDGTAAWTETVFHYVRHERTGRIELHGVTRDVGERRQFMDRLLALEAAIEQSPTSIVITDADNNIRYVNPYFTKETGYAMDEAVGQNPRILKTPQTPPETFERMWSHLRRGVTWTGELVNRRKSGDIYYEEARIAPVKDAAGAVTQYVAVKLDITERKKSEERIRHMAQHDFLTGLPNRELFGELAESALALARRHKFRVGLVFIDLDKFKEVNDTLGHAAGDQLLREVAVRIRVAIRESDTVARIGGDEFVVLLLHLQHPEMALMAADKIRQAVCQPVVVDGQAISVSASLGIAIYPDHGPDMISLSRHADEAMYQSKARGRNTTVLYMPNQA